MRHHSELILTNCVRTTRYDVDWQASFQRILYECETFSITDILHTELENVSCKTNVFASYNILCSVFQPSDMVELQ